MLNAKQEIQHVMMFEPVEKLCWMANTMLALDWV